MCVYNSAVRSVVRSVVRMLLSMNFLLFFCARYEYKADTSR